MDNRPIGFFDSGLGGLTCIPHMMEQLPEEKIIYFGDTARTPYGSKAVSTIQSFSQQIADFLVRSDVKMIVIACNTVSATAIDQIRERHPDIQVVGIIEPTAQKIAETCAARNRIGVIGTKVTVSSHMYKKIIHKINNKLKVFEMACPAFVPLIEEGIIQSDIMDLTIEHYLKDYVLEHRLDTLVLGCTHYPLIRQTIERMFPNLKIIDPSIEIVGSIKNLLIQKDMCREDKGKELHTFYASDLSENFTRMIERIFRTTEVKVHFKNLDI